MKVRIDRKSVFILIGTAIVIAALIFFFSRVESAYSSSHLTEAAGTDGDASAESGEELLLIGESAYVKKKNVDTILILGVDQFLGFESNKRESQQTDFLALLVVDNNAKSFRIVQINRDTMTKVPNSDAQNSGTTVGQIALAHAYGTDPQIRCMNSVKAVENLLYGISVDHYISLTMDAIPILNDSVGGVTLELLDDFTKIDPSYTKGAAVTLKGNFALTYVRERAELPDSTNLHRMERQRQYIGALFMQYLSLDGQNSDELLDNVLGLNDYLTTDCSINDLSALSKKISSYSYCGTSLLSGNAVKGSEYIEYYIDEYAAKLLIAELYYDKYSG